MEEVLIPSVVEQTTTTTTSIKRSKSKVPSIPRREADKLALAKTVLESWTSNSQIVLRWITIAEFEQLVLDFETFLSSKTGETSQRSPYSSRLRELDDTINMCLRYIKNFLENMYGYKQSKAHYAKCGIEKVSGKYCIPTNRQQRVAALQVLLNTITDMGMTGPYGPEFWQPIVDEYKQLTSQTTTTVKSVSRTVGDKKLTKEQIDKVLNSLIFLIKANYPDKWENELRAWGFLKDLF